MVDKVKLSRREFGILMGAGAAAVAGLTPARAAGNLVIGNWGGDSQALLQSIVVDPNLTPQGISTAFDTAAEAPRKVKILAERALPRGTMDIAGVTSTGSYELWKVDALQELDLAQIPAAENLLPELKRSYAIPQLYSTRVILYNPEKVTTKPTRYIDLWKPEYAGKVGVIDIQYQSTIESATLAGGGTVSDYEPGKQKLMELKELGVRVYPTNEAMAQALKSGECWMCVMWQARGVMWQRAGIPVEIAFPEEGLALYVSDFVMPKNARNKENAYAFFNALLKDESQVGFAEKFFYMPPIEGVKLDPQLEKAIGIPPQLRDRIILPDNEYLRANDAALKSWWDKTFKA